MDSDDVESFTQELMRYAKLSNEEWKIQRRSFDFFEIKAEDGAVFQVQIVQINKGD